MTPTPANPDHDGLQEAVRAASDVLFERLLKLIESGEAPNVATMEHLEKHEMAIETALQKHEAKIDEMRANVETTSAQVTSSVEEASYRVED